MTLPCSDPGCKMCNPVANTAWQNVGYTAGTSLMKGITTVATTSPDFAGVGFDLALGEIYGLRVWKIDDYGRLRARNIDRAGPWKPGVNTAKCHTDFGPNIAGIVDPTNRGRKVVDVTVNTDRLSGVTYDIRWSDGSRETTANIEFAPSTHAVPNEKCGCGFYAYSDPAHEEAGTAAYANGGLLYARPAVATYVLGVIRGSGRTLIGTKGFRCEKAEIVALRDPTRGGRKTADWRVEQADKLRRVYPDVPLLSSRSELLDFAPLESTLPDPTTEEFWALP